MNGSELFEQDDDNLLMEYVQQLKIFENEERCQDLISTHAASLAASQSTGNRSLPEAGSLSRQHLPESMEHLHQHQSSLMCPYAFDHILCWDETPANTWALQDCPDWFIGFENPNGKAKRFCTEDGTWALKPNTNLTYTEYRACIEGGDAEELAVHFLLLAPLPLLITITIINTK